MKRSAEILFLLIANMLVAVFVIVGTVFLFQFLECFGAAKRLPDIGCYPVMRIRVYGSSLDNEGNTVSARISLLDTSGTDFATIERSWKGVSLSVDFIGAHFSGKDMFLPYRIYGTDALNHPFPRDVKKDGTRLDPYFLEHGKCLLLGPEISVTNRHDLYLISRYAFSQASRVFNHFTSLRTINLAGCMNGIYYTVYTSFDGQLFLAED